MADPAFFTIETLPADCAPLLAETGRLMEAHLEQVTNPCLVEGIWRHAYALALALALYSARHLDAAEVETYLQFCYTRLETEVQDILKAYLEQQRREANHE
jgi:hypothetical protein